MNLISSILRKGLIASGWLASASSHSTGTALSGMMNRFLRNRDSYKNLSSEVRTSIVSQSEIRADRNANLKYPNAVIQEGLRLFTPVSFGMSRVVLEDVVEVLGKYLPGNVRPP